MRDRKRLKKVFARERFGQVVGCPHNPALGPVKKPVLGREHNDGDVLELAVMLDEGARLIPVQLGHHDAHENHLGLNPDNLGQGVEPIVSQEDLAPFFLEKDFGCSTNGLGVVDDEDSQALESGRCLGVLRRLSSWPGLQASSPSISAKRRLACSWSTSSSFSCSLKVAMACASCSSISLMRC